MSKPVIKNISSHIIGSWQHPIINDECAYCKFSLNHPSPDYHEKGLSSTVVMNHCGHGFHEDCINKWLTKSDKCPICMKTWIEYTVETYDNF